MSEVYPGMVLRVWSAKKGVYHYGIASNDFCVIDNAPRKGIALRTWDEFSEGEQVEIVAAREDDFEPNEIHERAIESIGQVKYSATKLNCEHFVNWCRRDRIESPQVEEKTSLFVTIAIIFAIIAFVATIIFKSNKRRNYYS